MITLTINDKKYKAGEGKSILQIAGENGIYIPSLCYHPAVEPAGVCRLCLVELRKNGTKRLVTSCNYPGREGLEIYTDTDEIIETRKWLIELLLAQSPDVEIIRKFALEYGIKKPRFTIEKEKCILCGLCVRICSEKMGVSVINFTGRGIKKHIDTPWNFTHRLFDQKKSPVQIPFQTDQCMVCGACASVCPTGAIKLEDITAHKPMPIFSEFNKDLSVRSPVYLPYPQGVPNVPVIDRDTCIHFRTGKCGICSEICPSGAIDYEQEDEIVEIKAGALILTPGFEEYDPSLLYNYGFNKYPNVVTSIQFERMLSASGPFAGNLVQPGNKKPLKKIAWIQCIGSRDVNNKQEYCSKVCCTYAIKQAIIALEHVKGPLSETIFFMDIRTQGKDFDKFYERAILCGVRFVRGKVYNIEKVHNNGNLLLKYINEAGNPDKEEYDLVVLSVGLKPPLETMQLVEKSGVQCNKDGFCYSDFPFLPETSKHGMYVAGAFSGPVDIPDTVMQASGAAASASVLLHVSRHTLTKTKEYPDERDVSREKPRIGVFICHCGTNIGGVINVGEVTEYCRSIEHVVYAEHNLYTCSQDTQERIKVIVKEHGLNRVVVASCSPRTHESLFQETIREAGLNKYLFEMANIRDQCSWAHMYLPELATEKAKDLVRMAIAKARIAKPLNLLSVPIIQSALVIGGGIAGMVAALMLADQGFDVSLLEKTNKLGGMARRLFYNLDNENIPPYVSGLINKVKKHPMITLYMAATIIDVTGYVGNFSTDIMRYKGKAIEKIEHGVAIIATGAIEYTPQEYLYGKDGKVMTQLELEEKIVKKEQDIMECKTMVMILCVGSRNENHQYCSKVCCMHAIKNALKCKEIKPKMDIFIIYRDIRTYGFYEKYYKKAREKGITFLSYEKNNKPDVHQINRHGHHLLQVNLYDMILKEDITINADILALSVSIEPPEEVKELATLYKVARNEDGFFLEAHVKLRPVDFATDGIFLCGLAHSPKLITESIIQAKAAASRASTLLSKKFLTTEGIVCEIPADTCSGCGVCISQCPYKAITIHRKKKIALVNEALCKGCGSCVAACPSGVAQQRGFTGKQVMEMINVVM